MSTIAELVSFQIAQTENDLSASGSGISYTSIKTNAANRVKADFFYGKTIPEETSMADLVKYFLADCACIHLIDVAIDWYKSRERLSDSKEGATVTWYDRIDALVALRRRLQDRIATVEDRVKIIAFGESVESYANLPLAQSQGQKKVTVDPFQIARWLYGDYLEIASVEPLPVYPERPGV